MSASHLYVAHGTLLCLLLFYPQSIQFGHPRAAGHFFNVVCCPQGLEEPMGPYIGQYVMRFEENSLSSAWRFVSPGARSPSGTDLLLLSFKTSLKFETARVSNIKAWTHQHSLRSREARLIHKSAQLGPKEQKRKTNAQGQLDAYTDAMGAWRRGKMDVYVMRQWNLMYSGLEDQRCSQPRALAQLQTAIQAAAAPLLS